MGALTSALLFVLLRFEVLGTEASSWSATVPSRVKGLLGSCVVIPCTYDFPHPGKKVTGFTGIWTNTTGHVIYHSNTSKIMSAYQTRTELLGNLTRKNCSLKIDPLKDGDQGPFHFRIEMEGYEKYSYKQDPVSIVMTRDINPTITTPGEVVEGQTVSSSCSVSHSCPSSPPSFSWNHAGNKRVKSQKLDDGQWKTSSILTFHSTRDDHNKPLICTVTYKENLQGNQMSDVLKVKFAPKIKTISCSLEGPRVNCVCIVESNPPSTVQFVLSDKVLPSTKTDVHALATIGTLQAERGSSALVHCQANNTLGSINVSFPLPHNSKMQNLYVSIAVGAAFSLLFIVIWVVYRKCSTTRGRDEAATMPHVETKAVERPQFSQTKSVNTEMDYDDINPPGIYSNYHIYGNAETDWDETIYSNI